MKILATIKDARTMGISGHIRPDGDSIGASLGLYLYLKKHLPKARIDLFMEEPPEVFMHLKGMNEIYTAKDADDADEIRYDVFFALDSAKERLGLAEKHFEKARLKINIDHHVSNSGAGDINVLRPDVTSACEVLYELLDEPVDIDADIAQALYMGIVHDTGMFRFAGTSARTLEVAALLMAHDFDFARLIHETVHEKTYVQQQILGRALLESIIFMDGRAIVSALDKKILDFYQASPGDLEGIVNQLMITKGVECAIFIHQLASLEYKVSLRSADKVNVAQIATFFGGGGHVRAAGVTMKGTVHDVVNNLSYHIEQELLKSDV